MNILDAIRDRKVFGQHFKGDTWDAWLAFLAALFALPMTRGAARDLSQAHRSQEPTDAAGEGGLADLRAEGGQELRLRGDRGVPGMLQGLAAVSRSRRVWHHHDHCRGQASKSRHHAVHPRPVARFANVATTIVSETAESVTLKNRIVIEVHAASFRSTRGYTTVAALLRRGFRVAIGRAFGRTRRRGHQLHPSRHGDHPRARCCCAQVHPHASAARCGMRTGSITATTTPTFWCGRPRPGT